MQNRGIRIIVFGSAVLAILIVVFLFAVVSDSSGVGSMDDQYAIHLSEKLPQDTYTLTYVNRNGKLPGYAELCRLKPGDSYEGFITANRAPLEAKAIGVFNSQGKKMGDIAFVPSFVPDMGKRLYRFGALSDVHIGYSTSEDDFMRALLYLAWTENVDFITVSGDLTAACTDEQLAAYRAIVNEYAKSTPVYAAAGNHDTPSYRKSDASSILHEYTGQPMYYSFEKGDDVFIMLGNHMEATDRLFTQEELQWFYETLEANKDKRCFVFQHVRPDNTSGNAKNIYSGDIWGGTEQKVFESLLSHYPNIILFHGHSHLNFALQHIAENANYDGSDGYHSIHIPSVTVPRTGTEEGEASRQELWEESEGFVVDVYENGMALRGRDFKRAQFLPVAQYYIPTPLRTVEEDSYQDPTCTIHKGSSKIPLEWRKNVTISKENGEETESDSYAISQLIRLDDAKSYRICSRDGRTVGVKICFYDAKDTYLGYTTGWDTSNEQSSIAKSYEIVPLENAVSMKIRVYHGNWGSQENLDMRLSNLMLTDK